MVVFTVQSEVLESLACDSRTPSSGGFVVRRPLQWAHSVSLLLLVIVSGHLPLERTLEMLMFLEFFNLLLRC